MTNHVSDTAARRGASPELRPDARLITLHCERGDAHSRLESALAALEGAEWGMTLAGEAALAQQLRGLLGSGVLRLDARLPLRRDLLAEAGLAAAGLEGDWRGTLAVWLLEPSDEDLQRAKRAGVPVIVDATLAPGAHWLSAGAQYVTYHHGATLTGFACGELALLFGAGERPAATAPAAPDLTAALALRDVATLPLRLARAAQTALSLETQLAGRALPLGPTALLLPPEAAAASAAPLGGVVPAVRPVQGGVLLTPGLAEARQVLALLHPESAPAQAEQVQAKEAAASAGGPLHDSRAAEEPAPLPQFPNSQAPISQAPSPQAPHQEEARQENREQQEQLPRHPQGQERRLQQSAPPPAGRSTELERFVFEAPRSAPATTEPAAPTARAEERELQPDSDQQDKQDAAAQDTGTQDAVSQHRQPQDLPAQSGRPQHRRPQREDQGRRERHGRGPQVSGQRFGGRSGGPAAAPSAAPHDALTPESSHEGLQPDLPVGRPGTGQPDPTADLTEEQSAVFARLRDWRNAEASRQEISRFIVASNATLAEIARRVPYTLEDLQAIKGMGPARLSKYGEAIVQVVRGTRR